MLPERDVKVVRVGLPALRVVVIVVVGAILVRVV